jgi:dihydrofolate reductase
MIGSTNEKIILVTESLETAEAALEMTLSYDGRSITVPARVQGPDEAGRVTLAPENGKLAWNVARILKATATGLRITMIAAADEAWGIGLEGRLPWNRPEDLRHFRHRTMGGRLVMGRTTFEGLPSGLAGRTIHVLSSAAADEFATIDAALAKLAGEDGGEILVAGGGRVYAAALSFCTHAEVTRIPGRHGCDAFMPDLGAAGWTMTSATPLGEDLTIEHWERKK